MGTHEHFGQLGFLGTFNVRDFAADPNAAGSGAAGQDDTAAINAAQAAALAYRGGAGGGRVVFDSGTWQTSAIIDQPEAITVEGLYNDTITYTGGPASPCVIRPLASHPGTAIWRLRGKAESGRSVDHTGARLRRITLDGSRTPAGTKGLLLIGLVREAEIENVTVQDTKDTGIDFSVGVTDNTKSPQSCRLAKCLADGAGNNGYRFANVPDTTITDCNSLGATNQGFLFQGFMNGQVTNIRAEWSGQHGILFSSGYWGTGQGSGGCIVTNITTDRNGMNGVYVDSTCKGSACIQLNGLTCRRDGRNGGSGGGSYAGLAVDSAATMPVIVDNIVVYPGVDDGGGGTLSPQFGINAPGTSNPVVISSGYVHAATTALNVGSATLVSPTVGLATGTTAAPTRVAPTQGSGGSGGAPAAHAATHATGGSDPIAPADIGAVATSLRGPIGGSTQSTLTTQTYTVDASGTPFKRWTLSGNPTISVPTNSVDGQQMTVYALSDSTTTRSLTFASGYELAQNVASRTFSVTNAAMVRIDLECRSGSTNTWVIKGTSSTNWIIPAIHASRHAAGGADPIAPGDIGAAATVHAAAHAAGGSDPVTPAAIGALASSALGAANGVAPLDANGRLVFDDFPAIPVGTLYATTSQTLATGGTSYTPVLFGGEFTDTANGHSTTTNTSRFAATKPGIYRCCGQGYFGPYGTGVRAVCLRRNGTDVPASASRVAVSESGGLSVATPVLEIVMAANDYLELCAYQNSGASQTSGLYASGIYSSSLTMEYVGPNVAPI